jgi:polar amino acid transport system substrate-binding protein
MRPSAKLALSRVSLFVVLLLAAWVPAALPGVRATSEPRQPQAAPDMNTPAGPGSVQEDLLNQVLAAGKLVVATDANYPPFSWANDDGVLVGFDVDVAKEVARRLGVEIEFKTPSWDEVTSGHWGAQWDVSIGSMTPTDQRSLVLWFTDPYYYMPGAFALHKDNTTILSVEDLTGKELGLSAGSMCQAWLDGDLSIEPYGGVIAYPPPPGIDVTGYDSEQSAIQDLVLGDGYRLDAVMAYWFTLQGCIDDGCPLKFLGEPAFYEPLVFALDQARGPSNLMLAVLNTIVADMRSDGRLAWTSGKWLMGYDLSEPAPPSEVQFYYTCLPLAARQVLGSGAVRPTAGR